MPAFCDSAGGKISNYIVPNDKERRYNHIGVIHSRTVGQFPARKPSVSRLSLKCPCSTEKAKGGENFGGLVIPHDEGHLLCCSSSVVGDCHRCRCCHYSRPKACPQAYESASESDVGFWSPCSPPRKHSEIRRVRNLVPCGHVYRIITFIVFHINSSRGFRKCFWKVPTGAFLVFSAWLYLHYMGGLHSLCFKISTLTHDSDPTLL